MCVMNIKVIIVDDHPVVREGIRSLLSNDIGIEVLGEAVDGYAAVELVKELRPDIVIIDVGLEGIDGIEATRQIIKLSLGTKVIALSIQEGKYFSNAMYRAGAKAYLFKDCAYDDLIRVIREVYNGQSVFNGRAGGTESEKQFINSEFNSDVSLTRKEEEVVRLLADGYKTKEIGEILGISSKTVDTHRARVMQKLNTNNLSGIIRFATKYRLTQI